MPGDEGASQGGEIDKPDDDDDARMVVGATMGRQRQGKRKQDDDEGVRADVWTTTRRAPGQWLTTTRQVRVKSR